MPPLSLDGVFRRGVPGRRGVASAGRVTAVNLRSAVPTDCLASRAAFRAASPIPFGFSISVRERARNNMTVSGGSVGPDAECGGCLEDRIRKELDSPDEDEGAA